MRRTNHDSTVLLTGYPGFDARLLAQRILSHEPGTLLYCLVSTSDSATTSQHLARLSPDDRARVVLLEGDPAGMDLGLSGKEFLEVRSRIDRIYHFAPLISVTASREQAEYVNVSGMAEVVGLAREASHLRCVVVRSQASVSGSRTGLVTEDELMEGQEFRNPIEETLAHAERIARRAMSKDLPIAVVRPSIVVGHSQTGEVDRFEGPYTLVLLILNSPTELALPMPARGNMALNVVPIDYVVAAAHQIGRDTRAPGRTFHLVDPTPLPARRVFELLAQAAGRRSPRGHIPSYIARAVLRAPGIERFLKSPRAFLEYLTTPVRYDARNAEEILAGTGISCPPFESYVDRLVAWVRDHTRQRRSIRPPRPVEDDDPLS
ncbi:MAG: SDR family oxidoreductase [Deltaproteobacteria bacterium]|nr:SDR family oxidoreductase [Deltaproteobacteria bacterium]